MAMITLEKAYNVYDLDEALKLEEDIHFLQKNKVTFALDVERSKNEKELLFYISVSTRNGSKNEKISKDLGYYEQVCSRI